MKRQVVVVVLLLVVALGGIAIYKLVLAPPPPATSAVARDAGAAGAPVATTASGASVQRAPAAKVTRITPEQRAALVAQIERARAARSASGTTAKPSLGSSGAVSDEVAQSYRPAIKAAMHDVFTQIEACYTTALPKLVKKDFTIAAKMTMTGDPDIGMVIDAQALVDETGQPLPPELDDCLRSTFQGLELPPLGDGEHLDVTYPFMFSHGSD